MDTQPNPELTPEKADYACISCGNPEIVHGFGNKLCASCRTAFIKYPIPLAVRIFGAVVLLIVLASLVVSPRQLTTGMHLERAKLAEKNKNYLTATRELNIVVDKAPTHTEALARLAVAHYYNNEMMAFAKTAEQLANKKLDDEELLNEVNELMRKAYDYYPSDSMTPLLDSFKNVTDIPGMEYEKYCKKHADDIFACMCYTYQLFNDKQYAVTDSMVRRVLSQREDYLPARTMQIYNKRALKQFDSAIYYCDRFLLQINREQPVVISMKARTWLQQKEFKQGLALSEQVHQQYPENGYCTATLALAYHVMNRHAERDKLVVAAGKDSAANTYFTYVKDVVNGKEKF